MRKKLVVTVPPGYGRDSNPPKHFLLTEWPAARAEKWGYRMALVLKGSSAQLPLEVARLGMAGIALCGLNVILAADVDPEKLEPLLDQMMECVKIVRVATVKDPTDPQYPLADALHGEDDIEEPRTIMWLRSEVFRLHTDFSPADALSALLQEAKKFSMPSTPTSPE
jgi:hypothetical protein